MNFDVLCKIISNSLEIVPCSTTLFTFDSSFSLISFTCDLAGNFNVNNQKLCALIELLKIEIVERFDLGRKGF